MVEASCFSQSGGGKVTNTNMTKMTLFPALSSDLFKKYFAKHFISSLVLNNIQLKITFGTHLKHDGWY